MPMMYYIVDLFDSLNRTREGRWLVVASVIIVYLLTFIAYTFVSLVDMTGMSIFAFLFLALGSGFMLLIFGVLFAFVDCLAGAVLALKRHLLGPGKFARAK